MGGVVLLGGGVLLAALLLKGKEEIHQNQAPSQPVENVQQDNVAPETVQLQPLTVDVETEKRLLEEQRRSREKAVAEQEAQAAEFLRNQQKVEAEAGRRAAEEYAAMNEQRQASQQSSDSIPPELIEDEKVKAQRLAEEKKVQEKKLAEQKKIAEQKAKSEQANIEERRKFAAEKKAAEQKLLEEKRRAEKVAADKKTANENKRKAEEAKKKAEADKARELLENGEKAEKQWMVQVALAVNEANADAVAAKLRAKGYKVTKSPTSKGIRIMVGPSKDRDSADATRKKINNDASLNMKSAWVLDWVPLDKR